MRDLYSPALRLPTSSRRSVSPAQRAAVRAGAVAALAASIAVPVLRRRHRIPASVTLASLAAGPMAVAVLRPRTRGRDIALFTLQMWGFVMAHELPYDNPERLRERLRIRYPIVADRVIGLGTLPNVRLQRAISAPGRVTAFDRFLSVIHWVWFMEPHAALFFVQARHPERFPSAARQLAATYDLGCAIYFAVPTAPPWWSAEQGYIEPVERVAEEVLEEDARALEPEVRRIMVDTGEQVWRRAWEPLYDKFNGNPWAAMPSLHFATSLMAAIHLAEAGRIPGLIGWGYAATLGFALVYLGEHYVTDLVAGATLVALVRRGEPLAEPTVEAINGLLRRLERVAATP
jgi:membrane-associated phospholipid phosphatase